MGGGVGREERQCGCEATRDRDHGHGHGHLRGRGRGSHTRVERGARASPNRQRPFSAPARPDVYVGHPVSPLRPSAVRETRCEQSRDAGPEHHHRRSASYQMGVCARPAGSRTPRANACQNRRPFERANWAEARRNHPAGQDYSTAGRHRPRRDEIEHEVRDGCFGEIEIRALGVAP